jgi:hypothetical protein
MKFTNPARYFFDIIVSQIKPNQIGKHNIFAETRDQVILREQARQIREKTQVWQLREFVMPQIKTRLLKKNV